MTAELCIGVDMAKGDDLSCVAVMQRLPDGRMKLVAQHIVGHQENIHERINYLVQKSFLPKSIHRSVRTTKKMIRRLLNSAVIRYE